MIILRIFPIAISWQLNGIFPIRKILSRYFIPSILEKL